VVSGIVIVMALLVSLKFLMVLGIVFRVLGSGVMIMVFGGLMIIVLSVLM